MREVVDVLNAINRLTVDKLIFIVIMACLYVVF